MYEDDKRIVMTLDAGGTNFVFGAMQGGRELMVPVTIPAHADNLTACLEGLVEGFHEVKRQLPLAPSAISFAFPGPADYANGIIGDLPNFPSFRGGVALGPMLESKFGIPVFINNDGSLFAYGEALGGVLPEQNSRLRQAGSVKQYANLLGVTLGTGFGGGVVLDGHLLVGDNGVGGDVWCVRNKKYADMIVEESVSIRAVKRVYRELSGSDEQLEPKDIYDIAEGKRPGDRRAAQGAFEELGEIAGDTLATAASLVDGIIVLGGGLAGAAKYIVPSMVKEMNGLLGQFSGERFPRLQMRTFNLDDPAQFDVFAKGEATRIGVPGTQQKVCYDPMKRIGIVTSKMGTSRAIALGAYVFALNNL